jgi:hypothetical protein
VAMKVFAVTDGLGAADVNEYMVNTKYAVKNSPTTRSGTSVNDDPDLVLNIGTARTFMLDLMVGFQGGSGGLKFAFTGPAGAQLVGYWSCQFNGTPPGGFNGAAIGNPYDGGISINLGTTQSVTPLDAFGVVDMLIVRGFLQTAGTAGNLTFRWSMNSASGNITAIAGSAMLLRRVA